MSLRLPICNVIFTAYYWDALLWCDRACRAITRPREGVRPLNIRRNVNKLYLIPQCLSYNIHPRTNVWLHVDMVSHDSIVVEQFTHTIQNSFAVDKKQKTLIFCSTGTSHSEKLMDSVWPQNVQCGFWILTDGCVI